MIDIPNPIPDDKHTLFGRGAVTATPVTWPRATDGALVICDEPEPMPIGTRVYPDDPRRGTFRYAMIFESVAALNVVIQSLQDLRDRMIPAPARGTPFDEPLPAPSRPYGEHAAMPESYQPEPVVADSGADSVADSTPAPEKSAGVTNAKRPVLP